MDKKNTESVFTDKIISTKLLFRTVINEGTATANDVTRRSGDRDSWNTIISIHLNETHMHIKSRKQCYDTCRTRMGRWWLMWPPGLTELGTKHNLTIMWVIPETRWSIQFPSVYVHVYTCTPVNTCFTNLLLLFTSLSESIEINE